MREKVVAIIGPTAVGKTRLSIETSLAFNGEVISGDSMQVYKGLDIGTAKVIRDEMKGVPHHLIDIKEPAEPFSAAEFQEEVTGLISTINNRGRLPVLAGGTGLYIQAVLFGYQFADAVSDEVYRKELEQKAEAEGPESIHKELAAVDPDSAGRIHPNNLRRVIRALEIHRTTGKTMTEYHMEQTNESPYDYVLIGLEMDRGVLYRRINERVDLMIEQGLFAEVKRLYDSGLRDAQSVQAIGYKEIFDYFDGKAGYEEAIENLKQNSRRYAKRQFTWFRNKMDVEWFDMTPVAEGNAPFDEVKNEIFEYIAGKLNV
ncbi:tRNA (adenosine(37)-N6)-dimethylallyltransferase MiaA [Bacillus marinisedimentorum]|uniref:tRNA (adenosine(37)-N6)-dimethylallyltransferase MiaA n=1 Tax=Bacillus marinisedimentorum TaxID=1821260 RepID=UPI0007E2188F|nr:tRNA (adenosine(37)-N6)-dimethylallyltransferase MiaA [Bacillus marinisedimentorum]